MTALRCATLCVADIDAAVERFERWMGYTAVERAPFDPLLAAALGAPGSAGARTALCQPASGYDVFLRFVEAEPVAAYRPIRTFGWAAIELCVSDVEEVHRRLVRSPFDVIGPPTPIGGLPTIRPMQVRGPDAETVFLTEILTDDPAEGLPSPAALIDHVFILVLACRDLEQTARWFQGALGLDVAAPISIRYSMINKAFALPVKTRHRIATARADGRIILELDEYPPGATERPQNVGELPPGVAIGTLALSELDRLNLDWIAPPAARAGVLYGGRRAGAVRTPEGALLELIEVG